MYNNYQRPTKKILNYTSKFLKCIPSGYIKNLKIIVLLFILEITTED